MQVFKKYCVTHTLADTLETVYVRAENGSYSTNVGTVRGKVGVPPNATFPVTEVLHNHNTRGLPIYSVADLLLLYTLYKGLIANVSEFSYSLVTPDNVYDLKITNTALFLAFALKNLDSTEELEKTERELDIPVGMPATEAEKRFLEFISDKGLTLLKPLNNQHSQWGKMQNVNDNIVIVDCNQ